MPDRLIIAGNYIVNHQVSILDARYFTTPWIISTQFGAPPHEDEIRNTTDANHGPVPIMQLHHHIPVEQYVKSLLGGGRILQGSSSFAMYIVGDDRQTNDDLIKDSYTNKRIGKVKQSEESLLSQSPKSAIRRTGRVYMTALTFAVALMHSSLVLASSLWKASLY